MKRAVLVTIAISFLAVGCMHNRMMTGPTAMASLEPRSGSSASGNVHFTQMSDGQVKVEVRLAGLTPGNHGFHIHDKGDCSAPDATSAGPHFDPMGAPHGSSMSAMHHAGDFGNVTANDRGDVKTEFMTRAITVADGPTSVLNRAVLVHADADDLTSQPAGNAGKRILCGVATMMTGSM